MSTKELVALTFAGIIAAFGLVFGIIAGLNYLGTESTLAAREQAEWAIAHPHPDDKRCRESGGFPIHSTWDGQLIECRALPVVTPK